MVVVEQDVLSQSFGGEAMTVAEATLIADNALEHTVRCILDALLASEILKSTKGTPRHFLDAEAPARHVLNPIFVSR